MGRSRAATTGVLDLGLSDAELAGRAAAGSSEAFEELYRRHAQVAWRVAQAVTGNRDDASDAVSEAFTRVLQALAAGRLNDGGQFRSYLLAATRNAAIDVLRRSGRSRPTDSMESLERPNVVSGPAEMVMNAADTSLVARAFLGLPERWRSVLWLTEVEGIPAREAAELLGLSPNGVAQLAVRARAGLRERFLQAHIGASTVAEECRYTVDHLGAYVAGGLPARDIAKVDQHLAGCEECRTRQAELEDLGTTLRKAMIPIPLGLGALALHHFHGSLAAATSAVGSSPLARAPRWLLKSQRPLAVMAVGLMAGGFIGLGVVGQPRSFGSSPRVPAASPPGVTPAILPAAAPVATTTAVPELTAGDGTAALAGADSTVVPAPSADQSSAAAPDASGDTSTASPPADGSPGSPAPPSSSAQPMGQVTAHIDTGPVSAAVALGDGDGSCTGGSLAGNSGGCTPPPSSSSGSTVSVDTNGSVVPEQHIGLP